MLATHFNIQFTQLVIGNLLGRNHFKKCSKISISFHKLEVKCSKDDLTIHFLSDIKDVGLPYPLLHLACLNLCFLLYNILLSN